MNTRDEERQAYYDAMPTENMIASLREWPDDVHGMLALAAANRLEKYMRKEAQFAIGSFTNASHDEIVKRHQATKPINAFVITKGYQGPLPRPACDCKGWGCWGCCDTQDAISLRQGTFL